MTASLMAEETGTTTDLAAERVLAASVMARPELIDDLAAEFDPADFSDDPLRWVWHAVEEIRTTLTAGEIRWEAVDRQLQAWRATGYLPVVPLDRVRLSKLYDYAQPAQAHWHAEKVTRAAVARRIVHLSFDANTRAKSPAFDPIADVAALQSALDDIVRPTRVSQTKVVGELIAAALERAVTPPKREDRIPTGFMDLDALTAGGFAPGQLIVIGARPAVGKTTLAVGFARAAAITNGQATFFASLEMSEDDIANGILCAEAKVALHHLKAGTVDDAGLARAVPAAERIAAAPLHIDDTSTVTLASLRAQVRHLVRTENLRLVIVDYLQLVQAPRAENRQVAVSMLSRGLKLLAKEFGVAVVILCQLNRGPEHRTDRKPQVSDLRESGAVEQDADIVLLLHREDANDNESPRAGEVDLIVGKHRGGPPGTITVAAQLHYARMVDMAEGAPPWTPTAAAERSTS